MLKIVFMGTPDFAVPSLKALYNEGHNIIVITQPDRPVGRGNKISMPAVKVCALELGIDVYQYSSVKCDECISMLEEFAPDLFITVAFGQILNQKLLDIPRLGCVNVHGSLLPKYRGAAPIQWAVINGERVTGITTMLTDLGLDTGDILLSREIDIMPDDTAASLFDRLSVLGAQVLIETINKLIAGDIIPIKQDESGASYYPMIKKSMAKIDFSQNATQVDCFIRGMYSWPVAYVVLNEGLFKIYKAHAVSGKYEAGKVIEANGKTGLKIGCADGAIVVDMLQAQGGKIMSVNDYLRGHTIEVGQAVRSEVTND